MQQQRRPVGQGDQPQGEEVVEANRFLVLAPQKEDDAAGCGAEQRSDEEPAGNGPENVDGEPAPAALPGLVQPEQTETEHDEGERRSVVEPGLPGEGESAAGPGLAVR